MTCPHDSYYQQYSELWTLVSIVSQKNIMAIGSDSNAQLISIIPTTLLLHTHMNALLFSRSINL